MNKNVMLLAAAACLAMMHVHATDLTVMLPPYRARAMMPLVLNRQHATETAEADVAADAAAWNGHVAYWHSFDVPAGVNGTQPTNINDLGEITGVYFDSDNNQHGFLRKADGQIETFNAPKVGYPAKPTLTFSGGTVPTGINNERDIVGWYTDAKGAYHGFVRSPDGNFRIIDDPSSSSSPPATMPNAINDWGVIVGMWFDSKFNYHGFVRQVDGSLTTVDAPGDLTTGLYHINNLGEVGGETTTAATYRSHGLVLHPDGKLVTFEAPNAAATYGGFTQALNLEGSFAGEYEDAGGGVHGYVRSAGGKFAEFTAPGAGHSKGNGTYSSSLNLLGTVIGFSFRQNGAADGYVRFANSALIITNAPVAGQQSTYPYAMNDLNEFTGFWIDANGAEHGFVALAVP